MAGDNVQGFIVKTLLVSSLLEAETENMAFSFLARC